MPIAPAEGEKAALEGSERKNRVPQTCKLDERTMPKDLSLEVDDEDDRRTGVEASAPVLPKSSSRWNKSFWKSSSMLVSDLWAPVPMGVQMALNVIKDLKQSVSEVMRVVAFEVHIPAEVKVQAPFIKVTIEGPGGKRCRCRRRRAQVFQTYDLSLHHVVPGVYRTKETNCDCRISRLQRRAAQCHVVVRVYAREKSSGGGKPKSIGKLSATVPVFCGNSTIRVELPAIKVKLPKSVMKHQQSDSIGDPSSSHTNSNASTAHAAATLYGHCRLSVLDLTEVFDVKRCRPAVIRALGHDEWRPGNMRQWKSVWKSPFTEAQLMNPSAILQTMTLDMKHDVILMYQTFFSMCAKNSPKRVPLSAEEIEGYNRRVLFLKRLVLCLAVCKLTYCIEENGAATHKWPFPLASALSHGSRILIRLDGVHWKEFTNFLLLGDPEIHDWDEGKAPSPMWARWAATHAVGLHERTSQLYEQKLSIAQGLQNLDDGRKAKHLGLDLPVGGFGNIAPTKDGDPMFIGPTGMPYKLKKVKDGRQVSWVEEIQHGHLYFRWDDFGNTMVPVLENNMEPGQSETTAGSAASGQSAPKPKEHWLQLPHCGSLEQLEHILQHHGYHHLSSHDEHKNRLFKHLVENNELSITANKDGTELRCRGVVIHLVIESEEDGVEKVLVQRSASALADPGEVTLGELASLGGTEESAEGGLYVSEDCITTGMSSKSIGSMGSSYTIGEYDEKEEMDRATHHVEDMRVPTMLRRRHESWTEAVTRICEAWGLEPKAIALLIEECRENEEEMSIYKCTRPVSHAHHHGEYTYDVGGKKEKSLDIEYQAYRFKFILKAKDRHLFPGLGDEKFVSTERGQALHGFAGHHDTQGTIFRRWEWTPLTTASAQVTDGLYPPEDRIKIVRETESLSSILLGIENSAPHKENFFGGKHTAAAKGQDTSPFGSRKWKDYRKGGQEVPADVGGMHLSVDAAAFKALQRLCKKVKLSNPYDGYTTGEKGEALRHEKDLFKEVLQSSDEEVGEVLFRRLKFMRPVLHGHAGTMVFDSFVKNRTSESPGDATVSPMFPGVGSLSGVSDIDLDSSDDEAQTDKDDGETMGEVVAHILEQGGKGADEVERIISKGADVAGELGGMALQQVVQGGTAASHLVVQGGSMAGQLVVQGGTAAGNLVVQSGAAVGQLVSQGGKVAGELLPGRGEAKSTKHPCFATQSAELVGKTGADLEQGKFQDVMESPRRDGAGAVLNSKPLAASPQRVSSIERLQVLGGANENEQTRVAI